MSIEAQRRKLEAATARLGEIAAALDREDTADADAVALAREAADIAAEVGTIAAEAARAAAESGEAG